MSFEIDHQTIKDLGIFDENPVREDIFSYFNKTKTFGGKLQLRTIMQDPLNDLTVLKERQEIVRFFQNFQFSLPINAGQMDFIDHYFRLNKTALRNNFLDAFFSRFWVRQYEKNDLYLIQMGVEKLVFLIVDLEKWVLKASNMVTGPYLESIFSFLDTYFKLPEIKKMIQNVQSKPQSPQAYRYDAIFRIICKEQTQQIINFIYLFDAYNSVAETAIDKGLAFPEYLESSIPQIELTGLFHPLVENPIPNNWALNSPKNLCFLSGPNMAGKSTFLKSLGLSVYLAHLGFPVPAISMRTSVYHGLVTTINLSDNIERGYSHFYSEVRRIKKVALMINNRRRLFVIFDELFRGTNVKDAFDASLIIINAFSQIKQSSFCISTHITEISEKIIDQPSILFKFFDVSIVETRPVYNFRLKDGVSHERLGMVVIRDEKILDILAISQENST